MSNVIDLAAVRPYFTREEPKPIEDKPSRDYGLFGWLLTLGAVWGFVVGIFFMLSI